MILHVSHSDVRSDSRILKQISALKREFNRVDIRALGIARGNVGEEDIHISSLDILKYKVKWFPAAVNRFIVFALFYYNIVKVIRAVKPTIVHCHDVAPLIIVTTLKRLYKYAIVYDAHELESDRNGSGDAVGRIVKVIERICWKRIDHFVTVSDSIKNWYLDTYGEKPVSVILNAPEKPLSSSSKIDGNQQQKSLKEIFSISEGRAVFVYVGVFSKGRGIELICDVFSTIDQCDVVFVGEGELNELLFEASAKFGNIHVHGKVHHTNLVGLIRSADVGLCLIENTCLSYYYSLPNKLFEYIAAGLYVVGSNFPEIKRVLIAIDRGACCEFTEASLKEAIYQAINQVKIVNKQLSNEALEQHSWEKQVEKLVEMYRNL